MPTHRSLMPRRVRGAESRTVARRFRRRVRIGWTAPRMPCAAHHHAHVAGTDRVHSRREADPYESGSSPTAGASRSRSGSPPWGMPSTPASSSESARTRRRTRWRCCGIRTRRTSCSTRRRGRRGGQNWPLSRHGQHVSQVGTSSEGRCAQGRAPASRRARQLWPRRRTGQRGRQPPRRPCAGR
jgi:hypothetical protein